MKDEFLAPLLYEIAPVRGYYDLTEPLGFRSARAKADIWAPAGFRTNFVTGRKLFIARRIVQDKMNAAAVVHDALYGSGQVSREMADAVFRDAMLVSGVAKWRAWAAWAAVRTFGGHFYNPMAQKKDPEVRA